MHSLSDLTAVLPCDGGSGARRRPSDGAAAALQQTMADLAAVAGEEGVLAVQVPSPSCAPRTAPPPPLSPSFTAASHPTNKHALMVFRAETVPAGPISRTPSVRQSRDRMWRCAACRGTYSALCNQSAHASGAATSAAAQRLGGLCRTGA